MYMLNVLWAVLGLCALLVTVALCLALLRVHRTLAVMEETLQTADEAMRELVPEVRGSLGNVNDITAALNVILRSAGTGASRLTDGLGERASSSARGASATVYGIQVAARSLWRSYAGMPQDERERGGRLDGG
jgi:uncharacterized protein YoxC